MKVNLLWTVRSNYVGKIERSYLVLVILCTCFWVGLEKNMFAFLIVVEILPKDLNQAYYINF